MYTEVYTKARAKPSVEYECAFSMRDFFFGRIVLFTEGIHMGGYCHWRQFVGARTHTMLGFSTCGEMKSYIIIIEVNREKKTVYSNVFCHE